MATIFDTAGTNNLSGDQSAVPEDDTIYGGANETQVTGTGNDVLRGLGGNDTLFGQDGADQLFGGTGNDTLEGGADGDTLYGATSNSANDAELGDDILRGGDGGDSLYGQGGADQLFGDAGADDLFGGSGNDVLDGGTENDRLSGGTSLSPSVVETGTGDDTLNGGAGNDSLYGQDGNDTLNGGDGADDLHGHSGTNILNGDAGIDTLTSTGTNDELNGGSGGETTTQGDLAVLNRSALTVGLSLVLDNNLTTQQVLADGTRLINIERLDFSGGAGSDFIEALTSATTAYADTLRGEGGDDTLNGGSGADLLVGGPGSDTIVGGTGNDQLHGDAFSSSSSAGDGSDTLDGGDGDDRLFGGGGIDLLTGGAGGDQLFGGDGNDTFFGGAGLDDMSGELGEDTMYGGDDLDLMRGGGGSDTIYGEGGNDQLNGNGTGGGSPLDVDMIYGGDGDDSIDGGLDLEADQIFGGAGNDTIRVELTDGVVDGGENPVGQSDDIDFIRLVATGSTQDIAFDLTTSTHVQEGGLNRAQISNVERMEFRSGSGNDTLTGATLNDLIEGGGGIDVLHGADGDDTVRGQGGDDLVYGDSGNDIVEGGAGSDWLYGGTGNDQLTGDDSGQSGNDFLYGEAGVDTLRAGGGDDVLDGGIDAVRDDLLGDAGDDTFISGLGAGIDRIDGGSNTAVGDFARIDRSDIAANLAYTVGTDTLNIGDAPGLVGTSISAIERIEIIGGAGNDSFVGGALNDILIGNGGNDTLVGGAGDDVLNGGSGTNALTGGAGNDALIGAVGSVTTAFFSGNFSLSGPSDYSVTQLIDGRLQINDLRVGSPDGIDTAENISFFNFNGQVFTAAQLLNDPPSGTNNSITIPEDVVAVFSSANFGFNDPDAGDALSAVRIDSLPAAGTLTLSGSAVSAGQIISVADIDAGHLAFDPGLNQSSASIYASFTFSVRDQGGLFDPSPNTLNLFVNPVNDDPVANEDTATTIEDTPVTINVLANDVDVDGPALSVTEINGTAIAVGSSVAVSGGSVTLNADNTLTFAPSLNSTTSGSFIYTASDGLASSSAPVTVLVAAVNDPPEIAGGDTAAVGVAENTTTVTTVVATDPDAGATLTYAIAGGDDASLFSIDGTTGLLSFNSSPNFEAPADAGGNNIYDVVVQASDGLVTDSQAIAVTVTNINEAPTITSNGGGAAASTSVAENTTAVTTVTAADPDAGTTITYSIVGGDDVSLFAINSATGALVFNSAPNFEAPTDADSNNIYDVVVQASDGALIDQQAIAVTVTDVAENQAPVITSDGGGATAAISVAENSTAVTTVTASDPDVGATLTYSISGGADASLFAINSATGQLVFSTTPDFEAPADVGGNNVYDVVVQVSDGLLNDSQAIAVTVTNVNEAPAITSNGGGATAVVSVAENTTAVTTVTASDPDAGATLAYSISGGADAAQFSINALTGALAFINAPDFEAPTDAGGNNVYDVEVQVSDGTLVDTQAIALTVTNIAENQAPVITSNGGGAIAAVNAAENSIVVTIVTATDPNAGDSLTYSLAGGADASLFTINATTGELAFNSAPNFEAPADAGTNNVYDVIVQVSDNGAPVLSDTQAVAVTVTNVNEQGVGAVADVDGATNTVAENASAGTHVGIIASATDGDAGDTVSYSLSDSAGGRFAINATTGVVTVANGGLLDFETATSHDITIRADSADGSFSSQTFSIAVSNVNEQGVGVIADTNAATNSVAENSTTGALVGITASANDPDAGDTVTYSLLDAASSPFAINATTGVVTVGNGALIDREASATQTITVIATSSDTSTTQQTFTIAINDVDEFDVTAISDTNAADNTVAENAASGAVVGITAFASDADATTNATSYAFTATGNPGGLFAIDSTTGIVTVAGALDYETATSHQIEVQASSADGSSSTQTFTINVTDVNEGGNQAPVISSNGGGDSAAINVAENTPAVTTISATDADVPAQPLTYQIVGGADAARFTINASTGSLSFASAPDFETPTDAGANNVYDVVVGVSDGSGGSDTQALAVTVTNILGIDLVGTNVRDVLTGTAEGETISGLGGNDNLSGQGGNDILLGGAGEDQINGGDGDDVLDGGVGADSLNGGNGIDTASYANSTAGVTLSLQTNSPGSGGEAQGDRLNGIENLTGSGFNDSLTGSTGVNVLSGGAGNDLLRGLGAADVLTGGVGADTFDFDALADSGIGAAADLITDFEIGIDKIDLSTIDANTGAGGNQAFSGVLLSGLTTAFTGAGQLRYGYNAATNETIIQGNVNTNPEADFEIHLSGNLTPIASDFIL